MNEDNNNNEKKQEEQPKQQKEFSVDINKDELKSQTKDTVNQVKESFKNTNFKDEANKTKGFILDLIASPISTVKSIVSEEKNCLPNAVMLIVAFLIFELAYDLLYPLVYNSFKFDIKSTIIGLISPIFFVIAFSAATYLFSGVKKKNINTILTGIAVACTPKVLGAALSIVSLLVNKLISLYFVFSIINHTLNFVFCALLVYTIKGLIESSGDENKDFRKAVVIVCVGYAIVCVLSQLNVCHVI